MSENNISLIVKELDKSKSGKSIFYIDHTILKKVNIDDGNFIEISGKKRTTGIAASSSADKNTGIIRLDNLSRLNAGVSIGDFVTVRLAQVDKAEKIILAPTQENFVLENQKAVIRTHLMDKPFVEGDLVEVFGAIQKKPGQEASTDAFMRLISFRPPKKKPEIGKLRLIIENTIPKNTIVKITRKTKIFVNNRIAHLNEMGNPVSYEDIGGLTDQILKIREIVETPPEIPELYDKFKLNPPKGIILYGPPGTGKTRGSDPGSDL